MPFNGQGVFKRLYNWQLDAAQNINMLPDRMDGDANDIASGLSNCLTRDGEAPMLAALPMGGFQINNLGTPTSATDAVTKLYVDTPTADRSMAGFKLTNLGTPLATTDAVNKGYVDTPTADKTMAGFHLTTMADPVNPQDAATKNYVDSLVPSVFTPQAMQLHALSVLNFIGFSY